MYHLRTPESRAGRLITWCGAEPEHEVFNPAMTGDKTVPLMTEWEWVKQDAHRNPGLCQECVTRITAVRRTQYVTPEGAEPEPVESMPF